MTTTLPRIVVLAAAAAAVALGAGFNPAFSQDGFTAIHENNQKIGSAVSAYWENQKWLGLVPRPLTITDRAGIAGAWADVKSVQSDPDSALDGRSKELIGLAVAAAIACGQCVQLHKSLAVAYGATDAELREALAMATVTRHWSSVLDGVAVDSEDFRQGLKKMLSVTGQQAVN
jgi:AhpD family alkylhydroperoxidase